MDKIQIFGKDRTIDEVAALRIAIATVLIANKKKFPKAQHIKAWLKMWDAEICEQMTQEQNDLVFNETEILVKEAKGVKQ